MRVSKDVRFSTVPEWLLYADVSAYAVRVWAVLDRHADSASGECDVSLARVAKLSRCSVNTAKKAVRELEALGAVRVTRSRLTPSGDPDTNEYQLVTSPPSSGDGGGSRDDPGVGHDVVGGGSPDGPKRKPLNESLTKEPAPDGAGATRNIVAFFVDCHRSRGSEPIPNHVARVGAEVKKLLAAGKCPELVAAAVDALAEQNKSPAALAFFVTDLERGNRPGNPWKRGGKTSFTDAWDELERRMVGHQRVEEDRRDAVRSLP